MPQERLPPIIIILATLFGGKLLQPDSLKKMITPGKEDFGLGVVVKPQGERVISHTGGIQGFVADLRYYPGKHLSVIVLSNTESKELSEQLSRQALSGTLPVVAPAGTLRDQILSADRQLFDVYNTCNTVQFSRSLASDLEFVHDSTGLTGHDWNVNAVEKRCAESTKYHYPEQQRNGVTSGTMDRRAHAGRGCPR